MGPIEFIRAKNFTRAHRERVDWIVIHTTEGGERKGAARRTAHRFAGIEQEAPQASAHYAVDPGEIVQCVCEAHVAWHAPGANRRGIGVEHAGRSSQTPAEWSDPYSVATLLRSAQLVAGICKRWAIPVVKLTADDLRANRRGICGHIDCTEAWRKSTHTDPGPAFPWGAYLTAVESELRKLEVIT